MLLSELFPGDRFLVKSVMVGKETGRRLADMGFTEDAEGAVIRRGMMGGPMQVMVRGYDLLIRREEAAKVEVELTASGKGRGHRGGAYGQRRGGWRFGSAGIRWASGKLAAGQGEPETGSEA
jgi:ferrous iron transport protein A